MTIPNEGTVICGTIQPRDLIPALMAVLREHNREAYLECSAEILSNHDQFGHTDKWYETVEASDFLNETLWDYVDSLSPDGCYFGAHPGDGCNYGFWKFEE